MKETGIIMSGEMVKAILDECKSMTRRTWGLAKVNENPDNWRFVYEELGTFYFEPIDKSCIVIALKCPYGGVGDWLWVKEKWGYFGCSSEWDSSSGKDSNTAHISYHADGAKRTVEFSSFQEMMNSTPSQNLRYPDNYDPDLLDEYEQLSIRNDLLDKWWKSKKNIASIHMPRWASRIWRQITSLRAERLQAITSWDCIAEGIRKDYWNIAFEMPTNKPNSMLIDEFHSLWDSLNAKAGHGWDKNEWVWPISW